MSLLRPGVIKQHKPNPVILHMLKKIDYIFTTKYNIKEFSITFVLHATQVKRQIIKFAQETWTQSFSRFFDVIVFSGISPVEDEGVMRLALNAKGIDFISKSSQTLAHVSFTQLATVVCSK